MLDAIGAKLSRRSDLAVAIRYALARWPALVRYLGDTQLDIDDNPAERALRGIALGGRRGCSPAPNGAEGAFM